MTLRLQDVTLRRKKNYVTYRTLLFVIGCGLPTQRDETYANTAVFHEAVSA